MTDMNNCTTDPISSNQVVEVGLFKPKCLDFAGNSLNDWLKFLAEEICCIKTELSNPEIIDLAVGSDWTIVRQPKMYKKGNFIQLSGEVTGGKTGNVICTLPFTPTTKRVFPIAHEFTPTTTYNVFLKIDVDRTVKLYFTGTAPSVTTTSSKLYLDNVSFFVE